MKIYLKPEGNISHPGITRLEYRNRAFVLNIFKSGITTHCFEQYSRQGRFLHGEHSHGELYHLVLYTDGKNAFSVAGKRYESRRGLLVLIPPKTPHYFVPCVQGRVTYAEVAFFFTSKGLVPLRIPVHKMLSYYSGIEVGELPPSTDIGEELTVFITGKVADIYNHTRHADRFSSFLAHKALADIFTSLTQHSYRNTKTAVLENIALVKEEIEKKYMCKLSLQELARIAGLCPEYLCRLFARTYGVPPKTYQHSMRMISAKDLLLNTSKSCKEIALETGFKRQHFFSRQFKSTVGMTPMEFRKNN